MNNYSSVDRYKFDPHQFNTHFKLIQAVKGRKNVLDIGCGSGYIGSRLKGSEVYGLEVDSQAADLAKKVYKEVLIGDVELLLKKGVLPERHFNAVVIGDVVEHLVDPVTFLKDLRRYLKNEAIVVISMPNVGHWTARLKVLRGNFDYDSNGIFDQTHLHFFTLKTITQLFEGADMQILSIDVTAGNSPLGVFTKILRLFGLGKGGIFNLMEYLKYYLALRAKKLFAYQFIFVLKYKDSDD